MKVIDALAQLTRWSPSKILKKADATRILESAFTRRDEEGLLMVDLVSFPAVKVTRAVFDKVSFLACSFPQQDGFFSFEDCDLREASIVDCHGQIGLTKSTMVNVMVRGCELGGSFFHDVAMSESQFVGSSLVSLSFMSGVRANDCSFDEIKWEGTSLGKCRFVGCTFRGSLEMGEVRDSEFIRCDFRDARFENPNFVRTAFEGCLLPEDERHVLVDVEGIDFKAIERVLIREYAANPTDLVPLRWVAQFKGRQKLLPVNLSGAAFEGTSEPIKAKLLEWFRGYGQELSGLEGKDL